MKYYIEVFKKGEESLDGYIETNLTPEQIVELYDDHPVGVFELTSEIAEWFEIYGLDFENKDYIVTAVREFVNETYEWNGEKLYPPPMFLPDHFNTIPVRETE